MSADLTLFDFPTRPPAPTSEQRALPIPAVSIEARYLDWKESPEGRLVWREITAEAGHLVAGGATRLSSKALVETVRARLKLKIDNSYSFGIARDLREIPAFRDLIEIRQRTAL